MLLYIPLMIDVKTAIINLLLSNPSLFVKVKGIK